MEEKIKQTNPNLHKYLFTVTSFSKTLALILFIVFPILGFYLGIQYEKTINPPITDSAQIVRPAGWEIKPSITPKLVPTRFPTPTPSDEIKAKFGTFKTYTSEKLGFQIKYPAVGIIHDSNGIGGIRECGKGIKEDINYLGLDDFYDIGVHEGYNSIQSYLDYLLTDLKKTFNPVDFKFQTTNINVQNADEAVSITQVGSYPDEFPRYFVLRKNNKIYDVVFMRVNESGVGCSATTDSIKNPNSRLSGWDFASSFKFL